MMLGILFNYLNLIYKSDYLSIVFEFIPKVIFFLSLIGYLTFLVIIKWTTLWNTPPPSLFSVFLGVFLHPGEVKDDEVMFTKSTQLSVQKMLLYLAAFSAVTMFVGKFTWLTLKDALFPDFESTTPQRSPRLNLNDDYEESDHLLENIQDVEVTFYTYS